MYKIRVIISIYFPSYFPMVDGICARREARSSSYGGNIMTGARVAKATPPPPIRHG